MVKVLAYTLLMIQLVCHLVTSENSSVNGTDQSTIAPPTTTVEPLPSDYVVYPEYGAAYRVSDETVSWTEAKIRCKLEGAYLAELDSYSKIQSVRNQKPSRNYTHVGYELVNGTWKSARTGQAVYNLPWAPSEPWGAGLCAVIRGAIIGLGQYTYETIGDYVCEIPFL